MSSGRVRLRLVLFGEQRSGTTLVADLLDAQPGVSVASGYLAPMMYTAFRELELSPGDRLSQRERHVLWQRAGVEREQVAAPGEQMPPALETLDDLHAHLLSMLGTPDDVIVGHKIHGPIEALPRLLELPNVRCVYVIRDVRDVLLSRAYRGERSLDEAARVWAQSASVAREYAEHDRLYTLRFEDLVTNPETTLQGLGAWLGREFSISHVRLDVMRRPLLQNSSFGDLAFAFDTRAVERFRFHKEDRLVRYAQWLCHEELRLWGYKAEAGLDAKAGERLEFLRRELVVRGLDLPRRAKNALLKRFLPSLLAGE